MKLAISNEANLRQQQYGWLVFCVSEKDKVKHIVETAYKKLSDIREYL